jgi:Ala-tRNA(Pro) deacylase
LFGQRVLVDKTLARDPEIVFNGGTHHDAIRMPYGEFERLSAPHRRGLCGRAVAVRAQRG